jgi:hypothetical protein
MDGVVRDENGVWKMPPSTSPILIEVKRGCLQALVPSNGEISLVDQFSGIMNAGPSMDDATQGDVDLEPSLNETTNAESSTGNFKLEVDNCGH